MDEDKKKTIMIAIVIACLAVAGFIFTKSITGGGGAGDLSAIPEDQMTLLKCRNPNCNAVYEMSSREYFKQMQEATRLLVEFESTPGLVCKECGEKEAYESVKCPKCELVFEKYSVPGQIFDRCPKCKYSEFEEKRKSN